MWWLTLIVCIYLLLPAPAAAHAANRDTIQEFCSVINTQLQELTETTKSLCGTNFTTPPSIRQLVTWTSIERTRIGVTNFRATGTLSYEIPDIIPDNAIEVLILAYFYASESTGRESFFKIYTEGDNGEEYAKYMVLVPGSLASYYTNTDNLWFPMTSSRRLFLNVPNVHGDYIGGHLYAIGYR